MILFKDFGGKSNLKMIFCVLVQICLGPLYVLDTQEVRRGPQIPRACI